LLHAGEGFNGTWLGPAGIPLAPGVQHREIRAEAMQYGPAE